MARGSDKRQRRAAGSAKLDLEKVRGQIDAIDEKIHSLINDRARLAQQVGISKTQAGKTVDFLAEGAEFVEIDHLFNLGLDRLPDQLLNLDDEFSGRGMVRLVDVTVEHEEVRFRLGAAE